MNVLLCTATAAILFIMAEAQTASMPFEKELGATPEALPLATWLIKKTTKLYKTLCNLRGTCDTDWSHLPQEHLLIPEIHNDSKCYPSTFEKEGCLEFLAEGLFSFRIFLEYLQETLFPKKPELTQYLWPATEFLANNLKSQLKNPESMQPIPDAIDDDLVHKIAMYTGWTPAILRHTILRRYLKFMDTAASAIRSINTS
ncbi:interleukin-6 [Podarcis lilfordi]|uniref:Interleukin-6 n=1 Tax=Podarcis lilfordi TaxID=74358 RepID=A0AA35K6I5_9SAUR|nr:interleukin-6 [Podarcis lilfordi]